ncbi:putative ATP binding protein [Hibiscus syriacus]|uniref:ATP binding protein n=1 Tax=Hibiscus syriacus TaxID=106335 RepID=A0A6A3CXP1_HIBSY|nr:putative ATP binding protein [Hibiscus syriacus]
MVWLREFQYAQREPIPPQGVAEQIISVIEGYNYHKPPTPLLISFEAEDTRKQAAASTQVVQSVEKYGVSVSRLRSCGVILIGKASMHEFGLGTTEINPNYGTTRNPHAHKRYTGGSSSGPASIVASGLCSTTLGTDGGGYLMRFIITGNLLGLLTLIVPVSYAKQGLPIGLQLIGRPWVKLQFYVWLLQSRNFVSNPGRHLLHSMTSQRPSKSLHGLCYIADPYVVYSESTIMVRL